MREVKPLRNPFHFFGPRGKFLLLVFLVFACVFSFVRARLNHYFPVHVVRVYGANRIDHQEIQKQLLPLVDQGFFNIKVDRIRERLLSLPWAANILVRRNWPDLIEITILEKQAAARWNQTNLVSEAGDLFSPASATYPIDLPQFVGPDGHHVLMLEYFNKMNRLLRPLHVKIAYLELTPYFTWKLKLDNGIAITVGHNDILTQLDQFVKVYPKIVGDRRTDVEYIDLRYPNGLAVRWKSAVKT